MLCRSQVFEIAEIMLADIGDRLREKEIELTVSAGFKDLLVTRGFNPARRPWGSVCPRLAVPVRVDD